MQSSQILNELLVSQVLFLIELFLLTPARELSSFSQK